MSRKKADRHPNYANHRTGGHAVGEKHARSGPTPGQHEFSGQEEKAMRAGAGTMAAPQDGMAMNAAPAGMMSDGDADDVARGPVAKDTDSDGM